MIRSRIAGAVVILALLQLIGLQTACAQPVHIVTAIETFLPEPANSNRTILTDSVVGQLCNTNEDQSACTTSPYNVGPGYLAGSATVGIQLLDPHGSDVTQSCSGPNLVGDRCVSDQLFLSTAANADGSGSVLWCWDSDLEPGSINVCQNQSAFSSHSATTPLPPGNILYVAARA